MSTAWETVIGLEVHIQLNTQSKIFSGSSTAYGAAANSQASAVDLGMPGVLPVINAEVIRKAALFGLAIDAAVAPQSIFARKHYFYPDLPKGYQISQYELPIVSGGHLDVETAALGKRRIGITRAHLEEDAGKSLHEDYAGQTGIDLNRAGTPLIECVSEPEIASAAEAAAYARKLHALVCYLGICDGSMQEGSFRVDANVSVRPRGETTFGTRTETKNLNSFRFLEKAIEYEIERQIDVIEGGGQIVQETRLYDPDTGETRAMRSKEEAHDYRYFPDPDLLPVVIEPAFLDELKSGLPELPDARCARFEQTLALDADSAALLTSTRATADYFEAVLASAGGATPERARLAANWINGELAAALNRDDLAIQASRVAPAQLAGLLLRIEDNTVSGNAAKSVFEGLWQGEADAADAIIEARGLKQITDSSAIEQFVDEVIESNPEQVEQYRSGKTKVLGFLVGQVMKASKGKAKPQDVSRLMQEKLDT
jgi:aspartyl-tRNA(Asn)/glutamyl-tRNA(Gln) amidotransferase subunit B